MYKLTGVSKQFVSQDRIVKAVRDVDLHIEKNEIFGIIGSSGAGKSTLVRCLNLLEKPDQGQVEYKGVDLMQLSKKDLNEERKNIGMIFQNFNLFSSRTVFENIAFPLKGKSKDFIKNRVMELLSLVDLSDKVNAFPSQLSGGQKQRVAIARALANEPDVLLCDEATSALDPQSTNSILDLLKDLNKQMNLTIILITHEMDVIKRICDRVAIMSDGYIIEMGSVVDVFVNPKKEASKEFTLQTYGFNEVRKLLKKLNYSGKKLELVYGDNSASQALISVISQKFNVEINIISGYIEVISDQTIGRLVVNIDGEADAIEAAINHLKIEGVIVNDFI